MVDGASTKEHGECSAFAKPLVAGMKVRPGLRVLGSWARLSESRMLSAPRGQNTGMDIRATGLQKEFPVDFPMLLSGQVDPAVFQPCIDNFNVLRPPKPERSV